MTICDTHLTPLSVRVVKDTTSGKLRKKVHVEWCFGNSTEYAETVVKICDTLYSNQSNLMYQFSMIVVFSFQNLILEKVTKVDSVHPNDECHEC